LSVRPRRDQKHAIEAVENPIAKRGRATTTP
jgi:hypothetical protein